MEPRIESTSAMSESPSILNKFSLEARFGKSTLSSFAFPIFEFGSSCSLSMLNLAERFGISRLVRKSSVDGKAMDIFTWSCFGSMGAFLRLKVLDRKDGAAAISASFDSLPSSSLPTGDCFFVRKRFMAGSVSPYRRFFWENRDKPSTDVSTQAASFKNGMRFGVPEVQMSATCPNPVLMRAPAAAAPTPEYLLD